MVLVTNKQPGVSHEVVTCRIKEWLASSYADCAGNETGNRMIIIFTTKSLSIMMTYICNKCSTLEKARENLTSVCLDKASVLLKRTKSARRLPFTLVSLARPFTYPQGKERVW